MDVSSRKSRRGRPEKACQSCRTRKIKCERVHNESKCKTCHERRTECKIIETRKNRHSNTQSRKREFRYDSPLVAHTPASFPTPTIASTADIAQSLSDSYGQSEACLAFLPCFTLPRCLVDTTNVKTPFPFSLFSPEGAEWVAAKAPPDALDSPEAQPIDMPGVDHSDSISQLPRPNQPYIALPPANVARRIFNVFFHSLHLFCEIFDEKEFMARFERDYPPNYKRSPSWWSCINAALALAYTLENRFNPTAWMYWKNASLSLDSFLTGPPRLLSVQALLAMTLFSMATFHGQLISTLMPLAIRTLQGLELPQGQSSPVHRRLCVIGSAIDIDRSLQLGIPPSQVFDTGLSTRFQNEIAELSSFYPLDRDFSVFNIYYSFTELTAIKCEIYRQLYSVKGQDKSDAEVITAVSDLDSLLQDWTNSVPQGYAPDKIAAEDLVKGDAHLSMCYMHFSYYNCLLTLHRRVVTRATWSMYLDPFCGQSQSFCPDNTRPFISRELCAKAARATMELALCIPKDHPLCLGTVIYFVVFAMMIMSILIIQDPYTVEGQRDVELMKRVEMSWAGISSENFDEALIQLTHNCSQYREIAEKEIFKVMTMQRSGSSLS